MCAERFVEKPVAKEHSLHWNLTFSWMALTWAVSWPGCVAL